MLEHGSFSAAGRELGMTQPAVSNHLRALEERFGV
ncbi:MAG: LysR family transcriptional regulator, partial [Actinomycetota bacterium]|nr:LysR family transcriptional regulator [Actinomycetota bacterium]